MKFMKKCILFSLGGLAYNGLELLWRGRTHGSMFLCGGSCFLLLGRLSPLPPLTGGVLGAGIVTGAELLTGLAANRDWSVWDYRDLPMNFRGQVCLPYSLLWIPVSMAAIPLYRALDRTIFPTPLRGPSDAP